MGWVACDGTGWMVLVMLASPAWLFGPLFLIVKDVTVIIRKTPDGF
jgi:hypothetical protein